jgi:hypothetical protein
MYYTRSFLQKEGIQAPQLLHRRALLLKREENKSKKKSGRLEQWLNW